jgi:hypothetical protein
MKLFLKLFPFSVKVPFVILVLLTVFSLSLNAQHYSKYTIENKASKKLMYGLKDSNGKIIVPAKYDEIEGFPYKGKAIVYKNDTTYLLDIAKKSLTKIDYPVLKGFNERGFVVIADKQNSGKTGYLNFDGSIIIEPKYEFMFDGQYGGFQQGLLCAKLNGKYGYIDTTGKIVKDFIFYRAEPFINGKAKVKNSEFSSFYYINIDELRSNLDKNTPNNLPSGVKQNQKLIDEFNAFEIYQSPKLLDLVKEYKSGNFPNVMLKINAKDFYDYLNKQKTLFTSESIVNSNGIAFRKAMLEYIDKVSDVVVNIQLLGAGKIKLDTDTYHEIKQGLDAVDTKINTLKSLLDKLD